MSPASCEFSRRCCCSFFRHASWPPNPLQIPKHSAPPTRTFRFTYNFQAAALAIRPRLQSRAEPIVAPCVTHTWDWPQFRSASGGVRLTSTLGSLDSHHLDLAGAFPAPGVADMTPDDRLLIGFDSSDPHSPCTHGHPPWRCWTQYYSVINCTPYRSWGLVTHRRGASCVGVGSNVFNWLSIILSFSSRRVSGESQRMKPT